VIAAAPASVVVPHIVVLGGSLRAESRSNCVIRWCAAQCQERGGSTAAFAGPDLNFPFYGSGATHCDGVRRFLAALADAHGVVVVSPAYHGTVSGLVKNALDYANELRDPARPYLDGRPLGCVAVSKGPQGAASTLATLRTIGHALRVWPTPLGVTLTEGVAVGGELELAEPVQQSLSTMLDQVWVLAMANARRAVRPTAQAALARSAAARSSANAVR
jgi:FMN reductase